jgi:hypothetical protein
MTGYASNHIVSLLKVFEHECITQVKYGFEMLARPVHGLDVALRNQKRIRPYEVQVAEGISGLLVGSDCELYKCLSLVGMLVCQ